MMLIVWVFTLNSYTWKEKKTFLIRQMSTETRQKMCKFHSIRVVFLCVSKALWHIFRIFCVLDVGSIEREFELECGSPKRGLNKWICIVHAELPLENRCALFFGQKNYRSFNFNRIEKCSLFIVHMYLLLWIVESGLTVFIS